VRWRYAEKGRRVRPHRGLKVELPFGRRARRSRISRPRACRAHARPTVSPNSLVVARPTAATTPTGPTARTSTAAQVDQVLHHIETWEMPAPPGAPGRSYEGMKTVTPGRGGRRPGERRADMHVCDNHGRYGKFSELRNTSTIPESEYLLVSIPAYRHVQHNPDTCQIQ
jgi:hypothetical protein